MLDFIMQRRLSQIAALITGLTIMLGFLSSCEWKTRPQSFLIIAVDSLPFDSIKCQDSDKLKGFKYVCDEMIRFTHAYTPSVLSQPALTSVLTGKYPFEHGVWNNGSSFLSAKFQTNSEVALEKGYRTFFISGGPPIWRKSGLDQGFEVFDDHIFVDLSKYYRSALENIRIFLKWQDSQVGETPFYSVLYLPDPQFRDMTTVDDDGYPREVTYDGQLGEIDESLEYLFENLKKKKMWENTWVFLIGLNGLSKESRAHEFNGSNLFHENTNVALFIKPATTIEHVKSNRKVDGNVSLVDVGRTLYSLLNVDFNETHQTLFKSVDLKDTLTKTQEIDSERVLLFESGWPQWRKEGRTLFALQKQTYLMLYEKPPKIFNTLVDRSQVFPIDFQQSFQVLTESGTELLNLLNIEEGSKLSNDVIEKMRLAHLFFNKDGFNEEYLASVEAFYKEKKDLDVAGWLASYYLQSQKWTELLEIGSSAEQADWVWIASRNKNIESQNSSACLRAISNYKKIEATEFQSVCSDALLFSLFNWVKTSKQNESHGQRESFLKGYRLLKVDYEIQKLNFQNGYVWDTAKDKVSAPPVVDIALALPELVRYKVVVTSQF